MPLNKKSIPCGGLVGKTFQRLTVENEYRTKDKKYIMCECSCSCGRKTTTRRVALTSGRTHSCGCLRTEKSIESNKKRFNPNAISKSIEWRILTRVRSRSKQKNIPFNLTIEDIKVPEICPLLGVPIESQPKKGYHPNSPSIDRIIPDKGYVKGNIWIISNRANTLKNDATLSELKTLVENLEKL